MDYSRFYIGDEIIYQGNVCANGSVKRGNTYPVVKLTDKPKLAFIKDEHGNEKLIKMGFNYAKISGT